MHIARFLVVVSLTVGAAACGSDSPTMPTTSAPTNVTVDFQLSLSQPGAAATVSNLEGTTASQTVETRARATVTVSGGSATLAASCAMDFPNLDPIPLADLGFSQTVTPAAPFSFDQTIGLAGLPFPLPSDGGRLFCELTGTTSTGGTVNVTGEAPITPDTVRPFQSGCVADDETLCVLNDRFRIQAEWGNEDGDQGLAPVTNDGRYFDGGYFSFTDPDSFDLLVQVIDNCGFEDHFWVFAAATTNVEIALTVTDTQTGVQRDYFNPLGQPAQAITDTQAFATCP